MADVISISSSDSDEVEIVDAYTNLDRDDPPALADLQIDLPQVRPHNRRARSGARNNVHVAAILVKTVNKQPQLKEETVLKLRLVLFKPNVLKSGCHKESRSSRLPITELF